MQAGLPSSLGIVVHMSHEKLVPKERRNVVANCMCRETLETFFLSISRRVAIDHAVPQEACIMSFELCDNSTFQQ